MKKLIIIAMVLSVSSSAFAFCNLNQSVEAYNRCLERERYNQQMFEMQQQQLRNQQEMMRQQQQQQYNNQFQYPVNNGFNQLGTMQPQPQPLNRLRNWNNR